MIRTNRIITHGPGSSVPDKRTIGSPASFDSTISLSTHAIPKNSPATSNSSERANESVPNKTSPPPMMPRNINAQYTTNFAIVLMNSLLPKSAASSSFTSLVLAHSMRCPLGVESGQSKNRISMLPNAEVRGSQGLH